MAEKKEYTPKEVADAVLRKCEELYKSSKLAKANTAHEIEPGSEASNDEAECPEQLSGSGEISEGAEKKKKKESSEEDSEFSESEDYSDNEEDSGSEDKEENSEDKDESESESEEDNSKEDKESKKDKKPFEKSEDLDKCGEMKTAKKAEKLKNFIEKRKKKDRKIEKFFGLGGTQTSAQNPDSSTSQGKPAAPAPGTSIADKINFGGKR
jgi:hypothetical protein